MSCSVRTIYARNLFEIKPKGKSLLVSFQSPASELKRPDLFLIQCTKAFICWDTSSSCLVLQQIFSARDRMLYALSIISTVFPAIWVEISLTAANRARAFCACILFDNRPERVICYMLVTYDLNYPKQLMSTMLGAFDCNYKQALMVGICLRKTWIFGAINSAALHGFFMEDQCVHVCLRLKIATVNRTISLVYGDIRPQSEQVARRDAHFDVALWKSWMIELYLVLMVSIRVIFPFDRLVVMWKLFPVSMEAICALLVTFVKASLLDINRIYVETNLCSRDGIMGMNLYAGVRGAFCDLLRYVISKDASIPARFFLLHNRLGEATAKVCSFKKQPPFIKLLVEKWLVLQSDVLLFVHSGIVKSNQYSISELLSSFRSANKFEAVGGLCLRVNRELNSWYLALSQVEMLWATLAVEQGMLMGTPGFGWWVEESSTTADYNREGYCEYYLPYNGVFLDGYGYNCLPWNGLSLAGFGHKGNPGLLEAPD